MQKLPPQIFCGRTSQCPRQKRQALIQPVIYG